MHKLGGVGVLGRGAPMLRLNRPVGAFPRLEARLAAIHLAGRQGAEREEREERKEEGTGCRECGGSADATHEEPRSKSPSGDSGSSSDSDTSSGSDSDSDSDSDCGCVTGKEVEKHWHFDTRDS